MNTTLQYFILFVIKRNKLQNNCNREDVEKLLQTTGGNITNSFLSCNCIKAN